MAEEEKRQGEGRKEGRRRMMEGGGRERIGKGMEGKELSSSVNKRACVHRDELGWLDNKDSNTELL